MKIKKILGITTLSLIATASLFGESVQVEQNALGISKIIPSAQFVKYEPETNLTDFFKVFLTNGEVIYVNYKENMVIAGAIWKNNVSLTKVDSAKWQKELQEKELASLSKDRLTKDSLKIEFGKGSQNYEFVIFTDPECPYCKKAEDAFSNKDVTVYVNFLPLEFHKNAEKWSLDVLSSANPKETLERIKKGEKLSIAHTDDAKGKLAKMKILANGLSITGTPKLFVIDKATSKIIDVINGADMQKILIYAGK